LAFQVIYESILEKQTSKKYLSNCSISGVWDLASGLGKSIVHSSEIV